MRYYVYAFIFALCTTCLLAGQFASKWERGVNIGTTQPMQWPGEVQEWGVPELSFEDKKGPNYAITQIGETGNRDISPYVHPFMAAH